LVAALEAPYSSDRRIKFTEALVAALPAPHPSGKQKIIFDSELAGLGIRLSAVSDKKSYIMQHKRTGAPKTEGDVRITIGPAGPGGLPLEVARDMGRPMLIQLLQGIHPKKAAADQAQRQRFTALDALELYIEKTNLTPSTILNYRSWVKNYLGPWHHIPMIDITKDMCSKRHRQIPIEVQARNPSMMGHSGVLVRGYSSADCIMKLLRAMWNCTMEHREDLSLPPCPTCALRRHWYKVPPRDRHVSGDELPLFYECLQRVKVEKITQATAIELIMWTGLRKNEALRLTWDRVDFASRMLSWPAITWTRAAATTATVSARGSLIGWPPAAIKTPATRPICRACRAFAPACRAARNRAIRSARHRRAHRSRADIQAASAAIDRGSAIRKKPSRRQSHPMIWSTSSDWFCPS
jgi:hypothetical protein